MYIEKVTPVIARISKSMQFTARCRAFYLLHTGFLLVFDPEYGCDMFL